MLRSLRTPCQGLLFIEHCMCLARTATGTVEGRGACKKNNRAFISKWQEGVGFWCSKNDSRKINTHQKEQQRNKKGIERAEEIDRDGVTSKASLKPFKVALRLGKCFFLQSDDQQTLKSPFKNETLKCRKPARVWTWGQVTEGLYGSS